MRNRKNFVIGLAVGCALLLAACAPSKKTTEAAEKKETEEGKNMTETGLTDTEAADTKERVEEETVYHKITAEEAKKMIDEGNVTVVDVRTEEEYAQKHIPDAVLVPNEEIGGEPPEAIPDQEAVFLIHCRTGVRSKQASEKLVELGYKHIYDFGGIVDWPYETESGAY